MNTSQSFPGTDRVGHQAALSFSRPSGDILCIHFTGDWKLANDLPSGNAVQREIESAPTIRKMSFDTENLKSWDSGFLTFLMTTLEESAGRGIVADEEGLPRGVQRLLHLAAVVPERTGTGKGCGHNAERVAVTDRYAGFYRGSIGRFWQDAYRESPFPAF